MLQVKDSLLESFLSAWKLQLSAMFIFTAVKYQAQKTRFPRPCEILITQI